ncbi:Scr1 family TA system antitoxin-like transcriptional regulator [Microbispora sp. NPDC088329]|uniref:Scr1 family TA system antitoxin-like transcriptional regulator n=1 Tax=Microbispora sp. NPDC088329 TaxID=3154869 RepID=UPI00343DFB37
MREPGVHRPPGATQYRSLSDKRRQPPRPWPPNHFLLAAQLDRISSLSTLENVSLGLLPQDRTVTALSWNAFVIHNDVEGGSPFVQAELVHGMTVVDQPDDVATYFTVRERLRRDAIYDNDARAFRD